MSYWRGWVKNPDIKNMELVSFASHFSFIAFAKSLSQLGPCSSKSVMLTMAQNPYKVLWNCILDHAHNGSKPLQSFLELCISDLKWYNGCRFQWPIGLFTRCLQRHCMLKLYYKTWKQLNCINLIMAHILSYVGIGDRDRMLTSNRQRACSNIRYFSAIWVSRRFHWDLNHRIAPKWHSQGDKRKGCEDTYSKFVMKLETKVVWAESIKDAYIWVAYGKKANCR